MDYNTTSVLFERKDVHRFTKKILLKHTWLKDAMKGLKNGNRN